jgi:hypothetical protein
MEVKRAIEYKEGINEQRGKREQVKRKKRE